MKKPATASKLASDIAYRSRCLVQVGAAIEDRKGRIIAWGWNFDGLDGLGLCAERHAILRASRKRLRNSTIYVAGVRQRNSKLVPAKPCELCQAVISKYEMSVIWRNNDGNWVEV